MRKLKASELVLDFDLYPRNNIDAHNVKNIVDAMAVGVGLPPIVIDKKSRRVIDGFHRVRAHLKFLGDEAEILVVEKTYRNDAAMFLDAMTYNAPHGAKLDPCDRTRCIIIAERLSIPMDAVAGALHMPVEKLGSLKNGRTATNNAGESIPLKNTVKSWAGKQLNKRQVEANDRLSGMNQAFYANQLIELIESKLIDLKDETLFERLKVLHGLLEELLVAA